VTGVWSLRFSVDSHSPPLNYPSVWVSTVRVRVGVGVRMSLRIGTHYPLSMFNILLAEMMMMETLDGFRCGLQIGDRILMNVRYADDIILQMLATGGRTTGVGGSPRPS